MGEMYTASGGGAAGSNARILEVYQDDATPTRRLRIHACMFGTTTTPSDVYTDLALRRTSGAAPSGGSAVTPENLDPGGPAALCAAYQAATGGSTIGNIVAEFPKNQRATYNWYCLPDRPILVAATQYAGVGLVSIASGATPTYKGTILFEE